MSCSGTWRRSCDRTSRGIRDGARESSVGIREGFAQQAREGTVKTLPLITSLAVLVACPIGGLAQEHDHAEHYFFELGDFALERGETLEDARVLYVTHGTLNEDRSNAVLVPSWYTGNHHGYDYLIGPERAIDTDRYFVIVTEMFGSGGSSSPSNTPAPQALGDFPAVTVRDNVKATYRVVDEQFDISHLKAIIGFSMGAQQAFQWAVSHPDFMDLIIPLAGTAKTYAHGVIRLESALTLLTQDASFHMGEDSMSLAARTAWAYHWAAWTRSAEYFRQELFKSDEVQTVDDFLERSVSGMSTARAHDYVVQGRAWQWHDVGATPGFSGDVERALGSIEARVIYMPGQTDMYFPITDAEYERQLIPDVEFVPIPSLNGHTAGAGVTEADRAFIGAVIRRALR